MEGFKILADGYRKLAEKKASSSPDSAHESIDKVIKTYDYLANADTDEIYRLYDSGIFNDITKAYCRKALKNCSKLNDDDINAILEEIRWLHDTINSKDISNQG